MGSSSGRSSNGAGGNSDDTIKTILEQARREMEAQQQALAAVEEAVRLLPPAQQGELRAQLDQVLSCVSSLRSEVAELRGGLHAIALQIIQDVK